MTIRIDNSMAHRMQYCTSSRVPMRIQKQMMLFCIIMLSIGGAGITSLNAGESTMNVQQLSIQQLEKTSPKAAFKEMLSRAAVAAMPGRTRQLYRNPADNTESFTDKAIMFHLRQRAVEENRTAFLSRFHRAFWSGNNGADFSGNCDHRFEDLFLNKQKEDFKVLQQVWNPTNCRDIVEIGTNSGLLLQHLTQNLTDVEQSVGIDINPTQIERNQQSDKFDPRINFVCTDGQEWIKNNVQAGTLFVTNGGVLEYFQREALNAMVSQIASNAHPSIFYVSEPIANDHDVENNTNSIPFGEELSFSHNYRDLFESNGLKVLHQRDVVFEEWKMQVTIAITQPPESLKRI